MILTLFFLQQFEDLDGALRNRKSILEQIESDETPFAVFHGPFDNLKCAARINGRNLAQIDGKALTATQAIDICFKAFHALRKDFTSLSECTWIYLESQVYKIDPPTKRKSYKNIGKFSGLLKPYETVN